MRRRVAALRLVAVVAVLAGCSGPILANPTQPPRSLATASPAPSRLPDPQPIAFPRDDGPHDRLTEWWYYTGHLATADLRLFGFEAVIFRAERGGVPVTWASHLALTDEGGNRFRYAQRSEIGPQVDISGLLGAPVDVGLGIVGTPGAEAGVARPEAWVMTRAEDRDRIVATLNDAESATAGGSFGLDLALASSKPPALHGGIGWLDFGIAGSSYYYSRTRLTATGTVMLDGARLDVTGEAWFDHQWGDFISVGGGGWDWFAVNLDDGTDLTISLVRAADGTFPLVYGTLVDKAGQSTPLAASDFTVTADPARTWTSPHTGATYPAGWTIQIPSQRLEIDLAPTVADQELDTRASTGVVYWEGSQVVQATGDGAPVGGEAYVELTGYATAH